MRFISWHGSTYRYWDDNTTILKSLQFDSTGNTEDLLACTMLNLLDLLRAYVSL